MKITYSEIPQTPLFTPPYINLIQERGAEKYANQNLTLIIT